MRDIPTGATIIVKGFLTDFPTPILQNIGEEPTREALIHLHQFFSGNTVSMVLNLGGDWRGHLVPMMTSKKYTAQTIYRFVPPHNPSNYLPTVEIDQEQALVTENFRQNQALFRKYTSVDGAIKNQIVTAVQRVFLSQLLYRLTEFEQVTAFTMLHHVFKRYGAI